MAKTNVTKKDLQKLISESIKRGRGSVNNTPRIDFVRMNEEINKIHNKIRIAIVKEGVKSLNIRKYTPVLSEEWPGMERRGTEILEFPQLTVLRRL